MLNQDGVELADNALMLMVFEAMFGGMTERAGLAPDMKAEQQGQRNSRKPGPHGRYYITPCTWPGNRVMLLISS